jgi:predicted porin
MKKILVATMLALPLAVSTAYAQDTSAVRISGFGTGALTWTNNDDAQFVRPNQPSGAKKNPVTSVDSNLGLQADYTVNSWLSLTGQGLVHKDGEDDYGAELSWAFAKAKLSDNLSVRVGRMGLPAFMISDYRNVGYANTFLRPPSEVYSQVPLNSFDGADVTWQQEFADTTFTAQLGLGRSKTTLTGGSDALATRLKALSLTAEHGPFTLRFGRTQADITVENSPSLVSLAGNFTKAGAALGIPQLTDMGMLINKPKEKGSFTSVGLSMDWNNVVAQTEYAKRRLETYSGDTNSWYALGGYRFGKFLPYYSHAKLSVLGDFTNTVPTACPAGYPAACGATVRTLYGTVEALRASAQGGSQSTDSIGVRWDFMSSADLKFQIDRVKPQGKGLFAQPTATFHGPVTVGAVAVDFVF